MIKFIRPIYFPWAFSVALLLFLIVHTPVREIARPGAEVFYRIIAVVLCGCFSVFSFRVFRADIEFASGKKIFDRRIPVKLTGQTMSFLLGQFSGIGRCQFRIYIRRHSKLPSTDEFEICGSFDQKEIWKSGPLRFAFNKGYFEMNVSEAAGWLISITMRPTKPLNEQFDGAGHIIVFGRAQDFSASEVMANGRTSG